MSYPRGSIAEMATKYPQGYEFVGVEVGVHDGNHADTMIDFLKFKKLYLVDPWLSYSENCYGWDQATWDGIYDIVVGKYKDKGYIDILRLTSVDAAAKLKDEQLDFVYIDGNHKYKYVCLDLQHWFPLIKDGGWLLGHDWTYPEVVQAVTEFAAAHNLVVVESGNGTEWWMQKVASNG